MGAVTRGFKTAELLELLSGKGLVAAPIHTIPQVMDFPAIRERLLETRTASGNASACRLRRSNVSTGSLGPATCSSARLWPRYG